jgi:transcriptional regulator with XRE-family HTH domain
MVRVGYDLNLREFAMLTGDSAATISRVERGLQPLTDERRERWARVLQLNDSVQGESK